jgi:hypothetical protein
MKPVKGARVRIDTLECSCRDCWEADPGWIAYETLEADLEAGQVNVSRIEQHYPDGQVAHEAEGYLEVLGMRQFTESEYGIKVNAKARWRCADRELPHVTTCRLTVLSEPQR